MLDAGVELSLSHSRTVEGIFLLEAYSIEMKVLLCLRAKLSEVSSAETFTSLNHELSPEPTTPPLDL